MSRVCRLTSLSFIIVKSCKFLQNLHVQKFKIQSQLISNKANKKNRKSIASEPILDFWITDISRSTIPKIDKNQNSIHVLKSSCYFEQQKQQNSL